MSERISEETLTWLVEQLEDRSLDGDIGPNGAATALGVVEELRELRTENAKRALVADGAMRAIKYTLDRIRTDVDLFYVMNLTEGQARLCRAFAELAEVPLEEVERAVNTPLFPDETEATIEKLRRRIAELES